MTSQAASPPSIMPVANSILPLSFVKAVCVKPVPPEIRDFDVQGPVPAIVLELSLMSFFLADCFHANWGRNVAIKAFNANISKF
jgi:hypothetical protein